MKRIWQQYHKVIRLAIIALVAFLFWLFPYLSNHAVISPDIALQCENLALLMIGIFACLSLSLRRDCFDVFAIIAFTPFIFARPFDAKTVPSSLLVALGLFAVGWIVSWIRFRPKIRLNPFFFGLIAIAVAMMLGGIALTKSYGQQLLFVIPLSVGLIMVFLYFSSFSKVSFRDFAWIAFFLSMLLVLQCLVYFLTREDIVEGLLSKGINLGWGISNNVAMILLLLLPFLVYFVLTFRGFTSSFFMALVLGVMTTIVFTYSRGGILAMAIMVIALYIYGAFHPVERKRYFITSGILVGISLIGFFICYGIAPGYMSRFFTSLFDNLDDMNGRFEIYKDFLLEAKSHLTFGYGIFAPFEHQVDHMGSYQWGHGTFIHTLYTMGLVGVGALLFHLVQKYVVLFKNHSVPCILVALGFLGSGLYGLIDVSYYFINYMVLLLLILMVVPISRLPKNKVVCA